MSNRSNLAGEGDRLATLVNGCCSGCGAKIVKNQDGAEYAKKQSVLSEKQFFIISWMIQNNIVEWYSKKKLYEKLTVFYKIGPSAFSARISELKALKFLNVSTAGPKPMYQINPHQFKKYLDKGMLL